MINQLRQFYNDAGELVVSYDPKQKDLYLKATRELGDVATSDGLQHHSPALQKSRNEIQRKYRKNGLILDLFPLPKGIHRNEGNFSAMVLKHFLQAKGFYVLVSEEDYYLMWERGHHYTNDGFKIIKTIFGTKKIEELLRRATKQGGDPDVFAFLDDNPEVSWFIEAKRQNEALTTIQTQNFPHIKDLLCPVEIARIVPLPGEYQGTTTHVPKEKHMKQNTKTTRYKIGKDHEYYERPTTFKHYLLKYRQIENLVIEALSQKAMDFMISWLTDSREKMEKLSDRLDIPLPRKVVVQFEDKITEVKISHERNVD